MRHIGTLQDEGDAHRFAAYLVTTGTIAHAEKDQDGWAIWVRDENQVAQAKEAFADYRHNPEQAAFQGVEREAENIRRNEEKQREAARKNVVEMRGRWGRPGRRRRPLTMTIVVLSVLVGLATDMGDLENPGPVLNGLLFCDLSHAEDPGWRPDTVADRFVDIRQGQIWRLVTPIFVHYGIWHLAFNMIMLYQLGSLIEDRRGTGRFGLMVIAIGIGSTLGEPLAPVELGGTPFAAGMSGVVFGLFGYAWVKTIYDPHLGILIARSTVIILMAWLFIGFTGILSQLIGVNVANWAHGVGFVCGVLIGYFPVLARSSG